MSSGNPNGSGGGGMTRGTPVVVGRARTSSSRMVDVVPEVVDVELGDGDATAAVDDPDQGEGGKERHRATGSFEHPLGRRHQHSAP